MSAIIDQLRGMKYQRMKLRAQLFTLEPKSKKRHPELADDESDLDDEFFDRWEAQVLETQLDKASKKFEKDNAKAEAAGEAKQPESALKEKLAELKAEHKTFIKERKTRSVEPKKGGKFPSRISVRAASD
jgi:DNA topoisomerase-1